MKLNKWSKLVFQTVIPHLPTEEVEKIQFIQQGENLEFFVEDKSPLVRLEVAKQGCFLHILVHDSHPLVRKEVAKQGAYLDILALDKDMDVRLFAKKQLRLTAQ